MGVIIFKKGIGMVLIVSLLLWVIVPFTVAARSGVDNSSTAIQTDKVESKFLTETELKRTFGGDNDDQCAAWITVCAVAGVATFFGGIAAIIAGPTALVCLADGMFDLSGCHEYAPFGNND